LRSIRAYQNKGGSRRFFNTECNFEPTCSEYTHQAIEKFGTQKGIKMGWQRIKRCNDPDTIVKQKDPVPKE